MDFQTPTRAKSSHISISYDRSKEAGYPPSLQRSKTDGGPNVPRPADRQNFRRQFVTSRFCSLMSTFEPLKPVMWNEDMLDISCASPVLMRRAVAHLLPKVQALFEVSLLPACNSSGWQTLSEVDRVAESVSNSASNTLADLLEDLGDITHSMSEPDVAIEALSERLAAVQHSLGQIDAKMLAKHALQSHAQAHSQIKELRARLALHVPHATQEEATIPESCLAEPIESARKVVALSREQAEAVTCPHSIFLQGRSGTGKTLVLVRRIARSVSKSQLYITKSSLLQQDVSSQLMNHDCPMASTNAWPPTGVLCATWQQLLQSIGSPRSALDAKTISYDIFLQRYWPQLSPCARHLPSLLVWAEFNSTLRPFGMLTRILTLPEYLTKRISAIGVRLDEPDLRAIYQMFDRYKDLKKRFGEVDDVDIAINLRQYLPAEKVDAVHIDEAQDFSPSELMLLLELCSSVDGVTVAGDTCQTINPGSAFSFQAIAEAFYRMWVRRQGVGAESVPALIQQSQLVLRCNYRSTSAVTSLAGSVTQLLQRFPHCIDPINEEASFWEASELPVFINFPGQRLGYHIMGKGRQCLSAADASRVVIVVPANRVREQLRQEGVTNIIILTVAEAKGLEYDIVIICGFFASLPDATVASLADSHSKETQIAELTTGLQGILYREGAGARLSAEAHARLCRVAVAIPELKSLYVAITRARQGCVFLECGQNKENWEFMVHAWQQHGMVDLWGEQLDPSFMEARCKAHTKKKSKKAKDVYDLTSEKGLRKWIESELAARKGDEFKQERNYLKWGLKCLQNGSLQSDFCSKFDQLTRERRGPSDVINEQPIASSVKEVCVEITECTSFVPDVLQRFCARNPQQDAMVMCESLRRRALQLYGHAMDDPRERWRLFEEARLGLIQARVVAKNCFDVNLHQRGLHFGIVPSTMATISQEICRVPSWRYNSALRILRSVYIWEHIWTFLVPPEIDVHNAVHIAIEEAGTHAKLFAELTKEIVLANAWHVIFTARHDTDLCRQGDEFHSEVLLALERRDCGQEIKIYTKCLWGVTQTRSDLCSEAGRAFMAVGQLELAAEAFTEASDMVAVFLKEAPIGWRPIEVLQGDRGAFQLLGSAFQRWHILTVTRADRQIASATLESCSTNAARSWLLIACASRFGNGWTSGEAVMEALGKSLQRSGCVPSAIRCAARARNIEIAALVLICAMFEVTV